ncbi:MAG: branched-chain amino acid ABC transporter permease [Pseudorhodoplanes sp.]|jgi:branched-chain amino acid transport system permease protein|nr:branched-chain amino acid ABC transporter permease [Pseudorhodoplanes sp.]
MTTSRNITSLEPARIAALAPWLLGAALIAYAWFSGGYLVTVMSFALIYAIFVAGLNVFMGFAGQVSFGQNAFAAISGYTSAVLTTTYGMEPLVGMAIGISGALAFALLIGYPTLRLKGHYLAMATLAVGLIVYEVAVHWQSVTQGYMGISGIPPLGIGRYEVTSEKSQLLLLVIVACIMLFIAWRIRNSRLGRAFVAVAGSEDAARALGIDVAHYKLVSFLISAGYAALAGSLFVHVVGFVSPEVYGMHMVVLAFTMLYVGGIGTIVGPLIGAIVISLLPEMFRQFKDYQDLIYGAVLILLLIYAPKGIASLSSLLMRDRKSALPS